MTPSKPSYNVQAGVAKNAPRIIYPFAEMGDRQTFIVEQDYLIDEAYYVPADLSDQLDPATDLKKPFSSPLSLNSMYRLADLDNGRAINGRLKAITKRWAKLPSTRYDPKALVFDIPGFNYSALSRSTNTITRVQYYRASFGNALKVYYSGTLSLSSGDRISLSITIERVVRYNFQRAIYTKTFGTGPIEVRQTGSDGAGNFVIVKSPTQTTINYGTATNSPPSFRKESETTTFNSITGPFRINKNPRSENVTGYSEKRYIFTGSPISDIDVGGKLEIISNQDLVDTISGSTTPSLSEWASWVENSRLVQVSDTKFSRWEGSNIYEIEREVCPAMF